MANIFDYIDWRGDLSFNQAPFNEIDNLILSRVSYFPFDNIIEEDEIITMREAYKRFEKLNFEEVRILLKDDIDLFPALAQSERFGELFLKYYVNKRDIKEEKQFSAITIILPDGTVYVSYRGTDNTLVGWKEDFNMSFMKSVPAQKDAKEYLEFIASNVTERLRIGGHSKGGNLAVYAAAFCNTEVQNRIIEIFNNDGPGFFEEIIETPNYQAILGRINTYIPQSSIIGRLLNHEEKCTIVKSTQTGIYQHDLYSWQLLGGKFIDLEELTNESEFIDKTLKKWLKSIDNKQREAFWMALFEVLSATQAETLSEIKTNWFSSSKKMFETYKSLDEDSKEIITKTLKSLFGIIKENFKSDRNVDEDIILLPSSNLKKESRNEG